MGSFAQIRQDEYPATDELQCIAVHIPAGDEYKALLAGFIAFLTDVNSYEDPESAQADGIAATFDEGYSLTNWDGCGVPPECQRMTSYAILFSDEASVSSGAAVAWVSDSLSSLAGYFQQSPGATADEIRWYVFLAAGNYSIACTYFRNTTNGRGHLEVYDPDGSQVMNLAIDMRGAAQRNTVAANGFTNPVSGQVQIRWVGNGASSGTSYTRPIQRLVVEMTSEL